jgi:LPXTG-site transpeptidase (sortase) family protein
MESIIKTTIEIILSIIVILNPAPIKEEPIKEEKELMTIIIDKLNINNKIYSKNSKLNNIDENVIIMNESDYPDKDSSTVIIGAHSGVGEKAYFKEFDKLDIGDIITLKYNGIDYNYKITNIRKDNKDGKISIDYNNKGNRLILYTCYPHDKNNYMIVTSYK